MEDALYEKLKDAIMEAGSLRHEAYEETRRRQKADRDLADASMMVSFCIQEMRLLCFDQRVRFSTII